MRARIALVVAVVASLLVAVPAPGHAEVRVSRAELKGSEVRVEGENAVANGRIMIDGIDRGSADDRGEFRIELSGFSSPTCRITVDDGTGPVEADLDGCTPQEEEPEPDPVAGDPEQPTWRVHTLQRMVGKQARFQVASATGDSDGLAFIFDFGDGTTLRDPESGFHPASTNVVSNEVRHTYTTPGEFTVTVTAVDGQGRSQTSEPRTMTVDPDHDDCAQGTDAADLTSDDPPLLELPVDCTGQLVADPRVDFHDTYRFVAADRALRLLTVQVDPPLHASDLFIELYTPSSGRVPESVITGGTRSGKFALTVNSPGEWMLRLGTFNLRDNLSYRLRLHAGGGGDDCVDGRGPTSADLVPLDAPNNDFAMTVLEHGEVDCIGSLPIADRDHLDIYTFDVVEDEIVALNLLDPPGPDRTDHCRDGAVRVELVRENQIVPRLGCAVTFFRAIQPGRVTVDVHRDVAGRGRDVGYRMLLATSRAGRQAGDCFTGGDAGDGFTTAAALWSDAVACIATLGSDDTQDWFQFPGNEGDQLVLDPAGGVFYELYGPDGQKHADRVSGSHILDQTGQWRLRFMTEWPDGREPFAGSYGFWMFPRRGVAGRDCDSGADTPVTGLPVSLPVACEGAFLPFPSDDHDRYNFELAAGETAEVTVAARSTRAQWTATVDTPSEARAHRHEFRSTPKTFTVTATASGIHSLVLERSPATDSLDLAYSLTIRRLDDDSETQQVELHPRVFGIGGQDRLVRGNTYCLETRVAVRSDSAPATDVTLTLDSSPSRAIRLEEASCDSFSTDSDRTRTVNIGGIPSPGERIFVWAIRADREGGVDVTLTAEDVTGATATATRTFTIVN